MASESDNNALVEHFRQSNSDLTLSDLAILIHVRRLGAASRQLMVSAVDAELQEVCDVLALLQNLPYQTPPCWCRIAWQTGHDGPCERARALWAKLEVK